MAARYGNPAFRIFHKKIKDSHQELHKDLLPPEKAEAWIELGGYLSDSFGNDTRIDYGTGHELHFVVWMLCFANLGLVGPDDFPALVLKVFDRYMRLVRFLQQYYSQEPAGSHGVWSLDDYQFIPFIWGASQLIGHRNVMPDAILDDATTREYASDYLYFACIKYIRDVKTGVFGEHSPDLYNISAAASWLKVNNGMLRKYQDDVISKFPIMQHFLFGSLIPYED